MGVPSVLINRATGEIIKHTDYPRWDMEPVTDIEPNLEWLVKYQPYAIPDYDSRIFVLKQIEEITTTPHPEYPHKNQ